MRKRRILVVDDEPEFVTLAEMFLEQAGYHVLSASSGEQGLEIARREPVDLVLLDIMMPRLSGWDTLRRLRAFSSVPVIFLTAVDGVEQRVRGLNLGADDYVAKPFHTGELVGRVHAVLQREIREQHLRPGDLTVGWVKIDLNTESVWVHGEPTKLTDQEWLLLRALASKRGKNVSSQALIKAVWPESDFDRRTSLKVAIGRLRRTLEDNRRPYELIHTVRQMGYALSYRPNPMKGVK